MNNKISTKPAALNVSINILALIVIAFFVFALIGAFTGANPLGPFGMFGLPISTLAMLFLVRRQRALASSKIRIE